MRWLLLLSFAVALGLGGLLWLGLPERTASPLPGPVAAAPPIAGAPLAPAATATAAPRTELGALPPLPNSLRGTRVDGGFATDPHGGFIATSDARDLFDYFLAASGEEPAQTIRARIEAEIRSRLPESARPGAVDLLRRYLDYREEMRSWGVGGVGAGDLERRLQSIREVRRGHFSPAEGEAFFALEELRWEWEIERRRVSNDPWLSDEERRESLAELEGALPARERRARLQAVAALELRRVEAVLRAEGAGAAEVDALREESVGAEAAARLAGLDRERASWQGRVEAWQEERGRLVAAGEGADRLARARAERFEGAELLRIQALEQMDAGTAP